ncbi:MAG: UspA [Frankiales bacterium]|nr:UspA [Frankiales bacterium]
MHEAARLGDDVRVMHRWRALPAVDAFPGFGYGYGTGFSPADMQKRGDLAEELVAASVGAAQSEGGLPIGRIVNDVHPGDPGVDLVEASGAADLLVLGTRRHGALASAIVGSTANYVLHHARCPVMIVPAATSPIATWARVVVGVDGSAPAAAALRWAATCARARACPLLVIHAWQIATAPDWLLATAMGETFGKQSDSWLHEQVAEILPDQEGLSIELRAVEDFAGNALLGVAGPEDLLVVGSRGRSAFVDLALGSVAMQCAHHARSAVAVVRV